MSLESTLGDVGKFNKEQKAAATLLLDAGQAHLFKEWPEMKDKDSEKAAFLDSITLLNTQIPGGFKAYVERARQLLADSKNGVNPYEGFMPEVPIGARLQCETKEGQEEFDKYEAKGMSEAVSGACFVLVAGGMGERLGYNGIKVELPINITTDTCYLDMYCKHILALQARARASTGDDSIVLPLAIMTSGDTDASTRKLIEEGKNFGMAEGQITIMRQETVPCLANNDAHCVYKGDQLVLNTKPHGHGDVHSLLYSTGLTDKWAKEGKKYVVFFQDTNGLVFRALPAALGVSVEKGLAVNSLTVPRRPGEAVGAICKLTNEKTKQSLTINVEYNQLDPLMTACKVEDKTDEFGFSAFPGNLNVLIFEAQAFAKELAKTQGVIKEFVNPKYADAEKTTFKKPTRLECMMQDYPKLLGSEVPVGFTQMERWTCFSAVKNNVVDAVGKQEKTGYAESACTGEADLYWANRRIMKDAGVDVDLEGKEEVFTNVKAKVGAKVVLFPSFGVTMAEQKSKFSGANKISNASTLVLEGSGIKVEGLELDGALIVSAVEGAEVSISGKVENKGYRFKALGAAEEVPQKLLIRGYSLVKEDAVVIEVTEPGKYTIKDGTLAKC